MPGPAQTGLDLAASVYHVADSGPHHKVWQRVVWLTNAFDGSVRARTNSYVEIATGLQHSVGGKWVDASGQIQITATGAQATNAQHSVTFAGNVNTLGAIQIVTPDGLHLTNNVLGLSYWDSATGKSAFIAEIRDSIGQLMPSGNEAAYPDAFDGGFRADLLYVNSISGFEQLVVFRELPPAPDQFGMNPATTYLQVITEFLSPPPPQVVTVTSQNDSDQYLTFGLMQMGKGEAFAIGSETNRIPVTKHWLLLDGRQGLVEQIPFPAAQPQLQQLPLPPPRTASLHSPPGSLLGRVTARRLLPERRLAGRNTSGFTMASAALPLKGFAMDYKAVTQQTNRVFQGDITYYVSGNVTLMGTNVFEGGAVIKFATNTTISITPTYGTPSASFFGNDYRPTVFTAKDDNSAGEAIPGSTGVPSGYYGNPALSFAGVSAPALGHVRFAYAQQAISLNGADANVLDAQFVNCQCGISAQYTTTTLRNVLFANTVTNIAIQTGCSFSAENVTFSGSAYLATASSGSGSSLSLTNCILANITNLTAGTLATSGDYNGFYQATSFGYHIAPTNSGSPFQAAGAANYYLALGSPYRNAGTTNIHSGLLAALTNKTTSPPIVYAQTVFSNHLTLSPQAQRNNATPDLGYSYDALDYAIGYCAAMSPVTISVKPGTVVGVFATNTGTYGLGIMNGARLLCQGSASDLARLVCFNAVQEQAGSAWKEPSAGMVTDNFGLGAAGGLSCRFTDFSALAQDVSHLNLATVVANLQDSQLHGGILAAFPSTMNLTNCLLERVNCFLWQSDNGRPVIRNNLFLGGTFDFLPMLATNAIVQDNLFDQTIIPEDLTAMSYLGGHNASVTNFNRMTPAFATDLVLSNSPAYQAGPLGNYYRLISSQLFNADTDTTADQVGLFHYTTITNLVNNLEIQETNSPLDIGYHYVATDANGKPIDSDGGGVPDYIENAAGDGQTNNAGEGNWQNPSDDFNYYLAPQYLRCEYRVDPWGVTTSYGPPRLYWIVTSPQRAENQVAYQIQVATSTNNLSAGYGDMWDSGKVYSDETTHVEYKGSPLASGQRLWWHVRTWDQHTGLVSGWSTNGFFQVGLLSTNDWTGVNWIGAPNYNPGYPASPESVPSPMYRSQPFVLTNQIVCATAYASAKGAYELYINGYRITQSILAPEWTDYRTRIQYQSMDVTSYLTNGTPTATNVVGAVVGPGWCLGSRGIGYYGFSTPQLLLRLDITNLDGSTTRIVTSTNWTCHTNGPVRSASIYFGETNDATREGWTTNWSSAFYPNSSQYFTNSVTNGVVIATNMFSQPNEPIKAIGYTNAIRSWVTASNQNSMVRVYDIGRIIVGRSLLTITNPIGTLMSNLCASLRHAELLQLNGDYSINTNGNIDTSSLQSEAVQKDTYVFNGDAVQQFQPHFTYHGFRYVEVTAPLAIATNLNLNSVTGCVIRSSAPTTGAFSCSNGDVNKLMTNVLWSIWGNLYSAMTDAPNRDEREGFLGSEMLISQAACFDVDLAAFFTKWIRDMRDAQRSSGAYEILAPLCTYQWTYALDPGWEAGGIIFPWRLYENYGDTRMLAEHYKSATNWVNYVSNACPAPNYVWGSTTGAYPISNGDWVNGDAFFSNPAGWVRANAYDRSDLTPNCASNEPRSYGTAWAAYSADLLGGISRILQEQADAQGNSSLAQSYANRFSYFTNLASQIRGGYCAATNNLVKYAPNGAITDIGNNVQGDFSSALYFNMIPGAQRANVAAMLLTNTYGISNYNLYCLPADPSVTCSNHISTGNQFAARELLELTRNGYTWKAYQVLTNYEFPSWLYWVTNDATTCWERWNSYLSGRGGGRGYATGNPNMFFNSFNSLPFGAVAEWIWQVVAGINPDDTNPGYKNVIIYPQPGGGVGWAVGNFSAIHGQIVCAWTNNVSSNTYWLSATIPANTTASIYLPSTNLVSITEGVAPATSATGVLSYYITNSANWANGATVFQLGSGVYNFTVTNATF